MSTVEIGRYMYIFCMFDLPVTTKKDRKRATRFKRDLHNLGFVLFQFSIYVAPVKGRHQASDRIEAVKRIAPENGVVYILKVMDRQYEKMVRIVASEYLEEKNKDKTLSVFGVQGVLEF